MTSQAQHADRLRELHHVPDILVLVNIWDPVSARTIAALPGASAIATGSWPMAAALGVRDEDLTLPDLLTVLERIVGSVDLPVTADLQAGYGNTPAEVATSVARAVGTGIAGCNLEDQQRPLTDAVARIEAARRCAEREGISLVINARLDDPIESAAQVAAAVNRAGAYLAAGADCVFPIRASGDALARVVEQVAGPVNAFGIPGGPTVAELAAMGVARVSFGPGPLGAALAALERAGTTLLAGGDVAADFGFRPSGVH